MKKKTYRGKTYNQGDIYKNAPKKGFRKFGKRYAEFCNKERIKEEAKRKKDLGDSKILKAPKELPKIDEVDRLKAEVAALQRKLSKGVDSESGPGSG